VSSSVGMTPGPSPALEALLAGAPGRISMRMGIDVDGGPREVERWFLGASLIGTRISVSIVIRTYRVLDAHGISEIGHVRGCRRSRLIRLLDEGGFARYDERTATRLGKLAETAGKRFPNGIHAWGASVRSMHGLTVELDALPGWGPVTVHAFLRELRGTWPGVRMQPEPRATLGARRAGLLGAQQRLTEKRLRSWAVASGKDIRDVESALLSGSRAVSTLR